MRRGVLFCASELECFVESRTPSGQRRHGVDGEHSTFMSLHTRSTAFSTSAEASGWLPVCADEISMCVRLSPSAATLMPGDLLAVGELHEARRWDPRA